jgi:hypothetical protein
MLFGPVRSAHRVELNTAAGLLTAVLQRGALPTVAKRNGWLQLSIGYSRRILRTVRSSTAYMVVGP